MSGSMKARDGNPGRKARRHPYPYLRKNRLAEPPGIRKFRVGCDVGLEPTTPRTTIWCSAN